MNRKPSALKRLLLTHLILVGVLCLMILPQGKGQDVHFSQIASSPLHLNPALTGGFTGDFRFNSAYRRQWFSVPVSYETLTGAVDFNFCESCNDFAPYSLGAVFSYDVAGLSRLSLSQLSLSGAIRRPFLTNHEFTFGFMVGVGQGAFNQDDLRTTATVGTNGFDPSFDDKLDNLEYTFFDISTGLNLRFNGDTPRSYIDIGLGVFHLNRHNVSFDDERDEKQNIRSSLYGIGALEISDKIDLLAQGLINFQAKQREILVGAGARFYFVQDGTYWKGFGAQAMFSVRHQDAYIPSLGFFYRAWYAGISYDINFSDFRVATNRRGGPEFTLSYIFRKLKIGTKKVCPIHL